MSACPTANERRCLTLPAVQLRSRNRGTEGGIFSALPSEIRKQVYNHYFTNSLIRYYCCMYFHRGKRKQRAYCHGPPEIALLLTNHTIYDEALPILQRSLSLLIDRTEAFNALRTISKHTPIGHKHASNTFPPLLLDLTRGIRYLILSNIHCRGPNEQIEPLSRPKAFPHLRTTTLFGVYPDLINFLDYGDTVLLGGRQRAHRRYWPVPWRPEVDLPSAARKLHEVLDLNPEQMSVDLRAWCSEYSAIDWRTTLLLVRADLDDPTQWYQWDVLARWNMKGLRRWRTGVSFPWYLARKGRSWERFEKETKLRWRRIAEQEEETED